MMDMRRCRSCGCQLSRYNTDSLCSACTRNGRVTPAWVWDSDELRRALAKLDLGAALSLIRSTTGLSQIQFGQIIGWGQSAVARAETGQRDTLYDVRSLLAVADALGMPRRALMPVLAGEQWDETGGDQEMELSRRGFGGSLVGIAAALGVGQVQVPEKVDLGHVRYFQESADRLYTLDQSVGGGGLAQDGLRLYRQARRVLDESAYSSDTGVKLMAAAGEIAVCVGWLFYDANDRATARALYSDARLLAEQAGNNTVAVIALQQLCQLMTSTSFQTKTQGYARQAITLGQRAVELSRGEPSPRLHALLSARQATANSAAGDAEGFRFWMSQAWRVADDSDFPDPAPVWLQFVTRSEIAWQDAFGRRLLGDAAAASEGFRTSLEAPALSTRNMHVYRASLAASLSDQGDILGAVDEGLRVLPALEAGELNSPRTVSVLGDVRRAASKHRAATHFCERYDQAMKAVTV